MEMPDCLRHITRSLGRDVCVSCLGACGERDGMRLTGDGATFCRYVMPEDELEEEVLVA